MDNVVIAVPSRGRPFGGTFNLLKTVKGFGVYVYVDAREEEAYSELYPDYSVIAHDKTSIAEIRLFIQEHQRSLDNGVIVLDDDLMCCHDLEGSAVPFKRCIRAIAENLGEYDCVHAQSMENWLTAEQRKEMHALFAMMVEKQHEYLQCPNSIVGLSPRLYDRNIRYSSEMLSEDVYIYLQMILDEEVKLLSLPYICVKGDNQVASHFDENWRAAHIIQLYLKFGDVIKICRHLAAIRMELIRESIEGYKENGPAYPEWQNAALANILYNRSPGWEELQDLGKLPEKVALDILSFKGEYEPYMSAPEPPPEERPPDGVETAE